MICHIHVGDRGRDEDANEDEPLAEGRPQTVANASANHTDQTCRRVLSAYPIPASFRQHNGDAQLQQPVPHLLDVEKQINR